MEESELTLKQRKWLEASRKIGPGPMTKSEKETLERLYAEMLPKEQQDLAKYIVDKFGKKDDSADPKQESADPIERMSKRMWSEPSSGLKKALSGCQPKKPF